MTNVHLLKLRSHLQADQFEVFGRERYLPALRTDATRTGTMLAAQLLRRRREHPADPVLLDTEFLFVVEWSGVPTGLPRVDDVAVQSLFEGFRMEVTKFGSFQDISVRAGEDA